MDISEKLKAGVPKSALRFTAGTEISGSKAENEKGMKVHLKARSRDPVSHWWFGNVAHDFSTLSMPAKIALDDSHGDEIGYGRPSLTQWGLEIDGVVIPNAANPQHEANRIVYNLENQIPQQASIDFSGDYDVLEVPEGMTYPVNGKLVSGPVCVIQNWSLRACAVCKAGIDPATEAAAQFEAGAAPAPRSVKKLSKESFFISAPSIEEDANNQETQDMRKDANAAPVDAKPSQQTAPAEGAETIAPTPEANADEGKERQAVPAPEPPAQVKPEELSAKDAENAALKSELEELKAKLSALAPGTKPVQTEAVSAPGQKTLWQQYAEIKNPAEKTLFYRKHKAEMKGRK